MDSLDIDELEQLLDYRVEKIKDEIYDFDGCIEPEILLKNLEELKSKISESIQSIKEVVEHINKKKGE